MANEELVGMEHQQRKKNVHDSFVMHTTWRSFNAFSLYDARPLQSPEYCSALLRERVALSVRAQKKAPSA